MNCYICNSEKYINILSKPNIGVWTNISDDAANKIECECLVDQCQNCGHIYQSINDDRRGILNGIYRSKHAQVSTSLGKGNWGFERAQRFLSLLDSVGLKNYKSALEIGCADGYLLKWLKDYGFEELAGVEPSIDKTETADGILFLKEFAAEELKLSKKYDLIFSNGVFEHIENIASTLKFCRNNLKGEGRLFFIVPNSTRQLIDGDPALFLHQHIHYYTKESLMYLLSDNGFEIESFMETKDSIGINAKISNEIFETHPEVVAYNDYSEKLDRILGRVEVVLQRSNILVHGANNALNNILGWLNKDFKFTLADNDNTKHGRKYFGRIVNSAEDLELSDYETVLIIPIPFYETIKEDYIYKGFNGEFESASLR